MALGSKAQGSKAQGSKGSGLNGSGLKGSGLKGSGLKGSGLKGLKAPVPTSRWRTDLLDKDAGHLTGAAGGGASGARPTRPAAKRRQVENRAEGAMDCRASSVYLRSGGAP